MSGFSILGSGFNVPRPLAIGKVVSLPNSGSSRYVDPRRQRLGREIYRGEAAGSSAAPKRLRCKTHPPAKPVVKLVRREDEVRFRLLTTVSGLRVKDAPEQAIDKLRLACCELPPGTDLHNSSSNRFIIRITLVSVAGFSKFEGTPAQMLERFPPLPSEPGKVS